MRLLPIDQPSRGVRAVKPSPYRSAASQPLHVTTNAAVIASAGSKAALREHFSVAEVLRIGIQIGSAVETAHRKGILHRDIKPHNILTDQYGAPALTDFGVAARKGSAGGDSSDGISVPWSAPEVLYGAADGDERADVYSMAATIWHLLVGHSPFEKPGGDNSTLTLMRRIQSDPPPPTRRSDVPGSLETLLRQTMAKDPATRPRSALDFVRALQAIEQEQRLPLTQIVLASEPPPESALAPGSAVGDDDATRVRPSAPARAQAPAAADMAATRVRGTRVEPMPAARPVPRQRSRVLPGSPQAEATADRPTVAAAPAEPADSGAPPARRAWSARGTAVVVIVVLLAAAVAVILAIPRHSSGAAPSGKARLHDSGPGAVGPEPSAPGTPTVRVARAPAGQLRFSWTYANRVPGDIFRWHRVSGGSGRRPVPRPSPCSCSPCPRHAACASRSRSCARSAARLRRHRLRPAAVNQDSPDFTHKSSGKIDMRNGRPN